MPSNEAFVLAHTATTLSGLGDYLQGVGAVEVIVDAGVEPDALFTRLEPLTEEFPKAHFIVLCDHVDEGIMFEAMEVGVRCALTKDDIEGGKLLHVLQKLARNGHNGQRGVIVTVITGSGGCGSTLIACNMANELGLRTGAPALYIDLDWFYGGGTHYLGLENSYSLPDILDRPNIDEHLIRSSAIYYSDNLHALPSPASLGDADDLDIKSFLDVLNICKPIYPYIILDAPRLKSHATLALSQASEMDFLIFQLDVKNIETVRLIRDGLAQQGISREKIHLVLTRNRWHNPLSLNEAKKVLKVDKITQIKERYKHSIRSMNFGNLLAKSAPRSGLRKSIKRLADKVESKRESTMKWSDHVNKHK